MSSTHWSAWSRAYGLDKRQARRMRRRVAASYGMPYRRLNQVLR